MTRQYPSSIPGSGFPLAILTVAVLILGLAATPAAADHCKGKHRNDPGCDGGGGGGEDVVFEVVGYGEVAMTAQTNPESSSKITTVDRLIARGSGISLDFLRDDTATGACFPDGGPCTPTGGPSGGCTTVIDSDGLNVTVTVPVNGLVNGSGPRDYMLTIVGLVEADERGNWVPGVQPPFIGNDDVDLLFSRWSVEAVSKKDRRNGACSQEWGIFDPASDFFTVTRLP